MWCPLGQPIKNLDARPWVSASPPIKNLDARPWGVRAVLTVAIPHVWGPKTKEFLGI